MTQTITITLIYFDKTGAEHTVYFRRDALPINKKFEKKQIINVKFEVSERIINIFRYVYLGEASCCVPDATKTEQSLAVDIYDYITTGVY